MHEVATKRDLLHLGDSLRKDIRADIRTAVEDLCSVFADAMTVIGSNFQSLQGQFDVLRSEFEEMKDTQGRIETKLDAVVDLVDIHTVQIKQLQQKTA